MPCTIASRATLAFFVLALFVRVFLQPEVDGTVPVTRYTYDNRATNRLQTLSIQKAGANLAQFSYALAPTGHRHRSSETGAALQPGSPTAARSRVDASFTYTASGQRWTMTDATGTTSYGYDHRDRLKTKATPQGAIAYGVDSGAVSTSVLSGCATRDGRLSFTVIHALIGVCECVR